MINEFDIADLKPDEYMIGGTHYTDMKLDPWAIVGTWPISQQIGVYRHGALKYLMRMGYKDEDTQELLKSVHYLEKLIEVLENSKTNGQV